MTDIKQGYQLHITTWENDGDNYKTKVLSGLTVEDVNFYIDLALLFKGKFGNTNNHVLPIRQAISKILDKNLNISTSVKARWSKFCLNPNEEFDEDDFEDDDLDLFITLKDQILHHPYNYYDNNFCRQVESYKVYLVPTGIKDVTNAFARRG